MQMLAISGIFRTFQGQKNATSKMKCNSLYHMMSYWERFFWLPSSPAGFRIGKGEGFADMEYGMMASMGAVNESTVVVSIVHDCQVSLHCLSSSYNQRMCHGTWLTKVKLLLN